MLDAPGRCEEGSTWNIMELGLVETTGVKSQVPLFIFKGGKYNDEMLRWR